MSNWANKNAVDQLAALRKHEISARELTDEIIKRAEDITATVNPIALELFEQARTDAIKADAQLKKGKGGALCGLPITVKDSQWLAGVRCANGSLSLVDFIPSETCAAIERLQNAGAIIIAKTTCPEFCVSGTNNSPLYGATLNPWDLTKTPGGSSGGAAASIAAGVGSMSLGGDGGGSIRIPAALCGVVGFKPSHGIVPRSPGFSTWESLVAYGPITRSVADAKLMFSVLADIPPKKFEADRPTTSDIKMIASEDLGFAPVDQDVRQLFQTALEKIQQAGFSLKTGHPGLNSSVVTWATVATSDMWKHKGRTQSSGYVVPDKMGAYAREFIKFGNRFQPQDLEDSQSHRIAIHDAYVEMFRSRNANVLITPTLGREAFHHTLPFPQIIENTPITYPWLDWAGFLYDANLVGMPACTIPMGLGDGGLPLGMQIMGLPGSDQLVLEAAQQIETALGWQHQVAPNFIS